MFEITWDYNTFSGNKMSFHTADEANSFWKALKEIPGVSCMRAIYPKTKPQSKFNVCRVTFVSSGKPYTYLCKTKINPGDSVIVRTQDGLQVVTVIDSGEMTESELAKICPMSKFRYIEGKVVNA